MGAVLPAPLETSHMTVTNFISTIPGELPTIKFLFLYKDDDVFFLSLRNVVYNWIFLQAETNKYENGDFDDIDDMGPGWNGVFRNPVTLDFSANDYPGQNCFIDAAFEVFADNTAMTDVDEYHKFYSTTLGLYERDD